MTRSKGPLFTAEDDAIILKYGQEWKSDNNRFSKISKLPELFNKFTSKQINHRWCTKLNPELNRSKFTKREVKFIIKWIKENKMSSGKIRWRLLIDAMKKQFGRLRSENMPKNFYYSRKGQDLYKKYQDESAAKSDYEESSFEDNGDISCSPDDYENASSSFEGATIDYASSSFEGATIEPQLEQLKHRVQNDTDRSSRLYTLSLMATERLEQNKQFEQPKQNTFGLNILSSAAVERLTSFK
ncbi:hypothetical protein RclHR1_10600006 [Rhizophagus clarus]|uniref:Myb-like domain-containing protein n=1 Tax=Rhizophagus clarus TaxID=94130 RepID=A0A2Z6QE19_9GLOM|nr:hypothetical protein RclHR1_10600006 [Rhizophagus clarus]GET03629.1 hypothetical protein GLOIN_2v1845098 [Rhizophagus clarus]